MSQPAPKTLGFFFWAWNGPSGLSPTATRPSLTDHVVPVPDLLDAPQFAADVALDRRRRSPRDAVFALGETEAAGLVGNFAWAGSAVK